ncbi:hypothetical protein PO909_004765 [Leuciscus waleckii]
MPLSGHQGCHKAADGFSRLLGGPERQICGSTQFRTVSALIPPPSSESPNNSAWRVEDQAHEEELDLDNGMVPSLDHGAMANLDRGAVPGWELGAVAGLDRGAVAGLDRGAMAGQGRQRFQRWPPWP